MTGTPQKDTSDQWLDQLIKTWQSDQVVCMKRWFEHGHCYLSMFHLTLDTSQQNTESILPVALKVYLECYRGHTFGMECIFAAIGSSQLLYS